MEEVQEDTRFLSGEILEDEQAESPRPPRLRYAVASIKVKQEVGSKICAHAGGA